MLFFPAGLWCGNGASLHCEVEECSLLGEGLSSANVPQLSWHENVTLDAYNNAVIFPVILIHLFVYENAHYKIVPQPEVISTPVWNFITFLWLVLFLLLLLIARQFSMLLKWKHLAFHCDLQVLVSNSSYSLLITVAEPLQIYSCCHVYESHWGLVHKAVKWGCHGLYEEVSIAPPPHKPNILSWSTMSMMTKSSSPAINITFFLSLFYEVNYPFGIIN